MKAAITILAGVLGVVGCSSSDTSNGNDLAMPVSGGDMAASAPT